MQDIQETIPQSIQGDPLDQAHSRQKKKKKMVMMMMMMTTMIMDRQETSNDKRQTEWLNKTIF